jgi:V8-like Glu-specific endopeptidase
MQSVLAMSDEQLAQALRPLVLKDNEEYVGEPAVELVKLIRAEGQIKTHSYAPAWIEERKLEEGLKTQSGIIGADNRIVQRNNTSYPWTTVNYQSSSAGSCSGTMVGPSTAITAAHCVNNGTNWVALPWVAPGTDFQDTNQFPFGKHGCYTVTIPTAYINKQSFGDARFDYAVIEFSGCNDYPGNRTGWKGMWEAPDGVITGNTIQLYGHPGDKTQPQIWGNTGRGILSGQYINFFMDAWFGDSGAGLYTYDTDGWPYVVGVLRGPVGKIGDDKAPNFGRRMTRDMFDFIIFYSAL